MLLSLASHHKERFLELSVERDIGYVDRSTETVEIALLDSRCGFDGDQSKSLLLEAPRHSAQRGEPLFGVGDSLVKTASWVTEQNLPFKSLYCGLRVGRFEVAGDSQLGDVLLGKNRARLVGLVGLQTEVAAQKDRVSTDSAAEFTQATAACQSFQELGSPLGYARVGGLLGGRAGE